MVVNEQDIAHYYLHIVVAVDFDAVAKAGSSPLVVSMGKGSLRMMLLRPGLKSF